MKRETLATGGVLGLSVLIASCCLGPALFLLFGVSVSALGSLVVLEPYRPYFIVFGGALLLYAGIRILRPIPREAAADCTGDVCAPRSPARRLTRMLFLAAAALYAVAIVYPNVLATLYG